MKLLAGSGKLCAKTMMGGLALKHNLSRMLHLMKPPLSHDPIAFDMPSCMQLKRIALVLCTAFLAMYKWGL